MHYQAQHEVGRSSREKAWRFRVDQVGLPTPPDDMDEMEE
jgi:hypothetical protein